VIAEGGCFFGFTDTVVTNSVCAGDYGIYASVGGGGSWKVTLRNTTIVGGVEAMVLFSNGPQMTYELFNTIIHTNGSGTDISGGESGSGYVWLSANNSNYAMTSESGGAHVEPAGAGANQTAAPQFVDPGNGNYSELPSSPTVGGGATDPLNGSLDLAGNPRQIGGRTDIGAYELVYPPVISTSAPSALGPTTATLNAAINPNGVTARYWVEYGTGASYGSSTAPQPLAAGTSPQQLAVALDGLLPATEYHYRVVAESSGGTTASADQTFTTTAQPPHPQPPAAQSASAATVPSLTGLTETNRTFAVAKRSTSRSARAANAAAKHGTVFSYTLDQAATVTVAIERKRSGRRPKTLTRTASPGPDKLRFTGRIGGKALPPGRYRAVFTAADTAGASPPRSIGFTILPR